MAAITNFITNPTFASNTTSHAGSRGTITLDSTKGFHGSSSGRFVADGVAGANYLSTTVPLSQNIVGQSVTFSIYGQAELAGASLYTRIYFRDSANVILGSSVDPAAITLPTSGWARASVTATAPAGTNNINIYSILSPTSLASGTTVWFDAMMLNVGNLSGYADGSSSNWTWNGAANSSSSTGPPL